MFETDAEIAQLQAMSSMWAYAFHPEEFPE